MRDRIHKMELKKAKNRILGKNCPCVILIKMMVVMSMQKSSIQT